MAPLSRPGVRTPDGPLLFTMVYFSLSRESRPACGGPKGGRKEAGDTPAPPAMGLRPPAPPAVLFRGFVPVLKSTTIRRHERRKEIVGGHPQPPPGGLRPPGPPEGNAHGDNPRPSCKRLHSRF